MIGRRGIVMTTALVAMPLAAAGPAVELTDLERDGTDLRATVELGPEREPLTVLVRAATGAELLRVGWRDGAVFAKLPPGGPPTAFHVDGFDCDAWTADGRRAALSRAELESTAALQRIAGRRPPTPDEIEAASLVRLLRDVLDGACVADRSGDEPLPAAGACYYDNRDSFYACKGCCERTDGLLEMACGYAATYVCTGGAWWCGSVANGACSQAVEFNSTHCVRHNCAGLPGDGSCPEPRPPCTGLCMSFCGPGWSSSCGACPGPDDDANQGACCS